LGFVPGRLKRALLYEGVTYLYSRWYGLVMVAQVGKYKGHEVISLISKDVNGVERRFSFGRKKARLILENIDDIRSFAEAENDG
jgi:hypothetical protein